MTASFAMFLALMIDLRWGWPDHLFRKFGHPVTWIGSCIAHGERLLNREGNPVWQKISGTLLVFFLVASVLVFTWIISILLPQGPVWLLVTAIFSWPLIAAKSLSDHVRWVADPLALDDLSKAREEIAKIVGRDPETLDDAGIARAAIESLAENTSDGVTAPLFWGVVLGLPGIAAYKCINTLDSMIGYRNKRYQDFGFAAAKLDDIVNWIPARLTCLMFALLSGRPAMILQKVRNDAPSHRSPNAGYPETAMAAALGIRLSGPRSYHGKTEHAPWLNEKGRDPDAGDIQKALTLYRRFLIFCAVLLLFLTGILWFL